MHETDSAAQEADVRKELPKRIRFPAATRVMLHAAIEKVFAQLGDSDDVEILRQRLSEEIEGVFVDPNEVQAIEHSIVDLRTRLSRTEIGGPGKSPHGHADLHFSEEVLIQMAEISLRSYLPRNRAALALLAALLEAKQSMTAEMLSQRTGYSAGRMVSDIQSLKRGALDGIGWKISGKSTTGWTLIRS